MHWNAWISFLFKYEELRLSRNAWYLLFYFSSRRDTALHNPNYSFLLSIYGAVITLSCQLCCHCKDDWQFCTTSTLIYFWLDPFFYHISNLGIHMLQTICWYHLYITAVSSCHCLRYPCPVHALSMQYFIPWCFLPSFIHGCVISFFVFKTLIALLQF